MVAFLDSCWRTSGRWDLGKCLTVLWWGTRGSVLVCVCGGGEEGKGGGKGREGRKGRGGGKGREGRKGREGGRGGGGECNDKKWV